MTVRLMLTCLCDAFYGEVGIATVRVLEHAGCHVEFPEEQTCCGQPPYNAGNWSEARRIADHCTRVFGLLEPDAAPVVTPSSSCAAMVREGYSLLYGTAMHPPVFELAEFLVHRLGIEVWNGEVTPTRVAYHRACHGRALGLRDEQERLLASIQGVELMPVAQSEQCCGFGGAFSIGHSYVSAGIGDEKLKNVAESGADELVSGDMGCLMHLQGLIARDGLKLQSRHFAQVLAEAIPGGVVV